MKTSFLRVVANPYAHLDEDGEPAGVAHRHDTGRAPIGAAPDKARAPKLAGHARNTYRSSLGPTKWIFRDAVEQLPDTAGHRRLVQSRAVLAADAATAKLCGMPFVPPAQALAGARAGAIAAWRAAHGEDPAFVEQEAAAARAAAPPAPPPPTPQPTAAPAGGNA